MIEALLANLLQSSRSTLSRGSFLSFLAFKEGRLSTPISVLGGWPTVSVRLLVERVTVEVHEASEQVEVTLQWAGGVTSAHRLRCPVARYDQLSNYPALLAYIDGLRQTGHHFAQIAAQLNRAGFAPPKRTERFTGETVA